jgi:hypothetical protein
MSMEDSIVTGGNVNYDEPALVEVEADGVDYRLDAGQGSSVAISHRPTGRWQWSVLAEGRWDGSTLRAKPLGFELSSTLGRALAQAMQEREG